MARRRCDQNCGHQLMHARQGLEILGAEHCDDQQCNNNILAILYACTYPDVCVCVCVCWMPCWPRASPVLDMRHKNAPYVALPDVVHAYPRSMLVPNLKLHSFDSQRELRELLFWVQCTRIMHLTVALQPNSLVLARLTVC